MMYTATGRGHWSGDLENWVSELEQTFYSIQNQHFRWPYVIDWVAEVIVCSKLSPWSWFDHGGAEFVRPEGTGDATATNWCFWGLWVYSTPGSAGWEIQTLWVLHRSCGSLANIYACSQFVTFLLLGNNSLELIWRIHKSKSVFSILSNNNWKITVLADRIAEYYCPQDFAHALLLLRYNRSSPYGESYYQQCVSVLLPLTSALHLPVGPFSWLCPLMVFPLSICLERPLHYHVFVPRHVCALMLDITVM
jgi:hypothetical protein